MQKAGEAETGLRDPAAGFARLVEIMAQLRDPQSGCPWDIEQTFQSIAPYTIEEAYEVLDAIMRGNLADLCEELGDLLLQVVFHAQMADDNGAFDIADVVEAISSKMVARHPHVFGSDTVEDAAATIDQWEALKAAERRAKASSTKGSSVLDDVAMALPALLRAEKLQKRAARVGFDWAEAADVAPKIEKELAEVLEAAEGGDQSAVAEEVGDLLFAVVNLARKLDVDPETALRQANDKFTRRFQWIERHCPGPVEAQSLAELDRLWDQAKANEPKTAIASD